MKPQNPIRTVDPMRARAALLSMCFLCFVGLAAGQTLSGNDSPREQLVSETTGENQRAATSDVSSTPDLEAGRLISFRSLGSNIVRDEKAIWLFPAHVAHGKHWKPALAITAVTGALIALDPHDEPYFVNSSRFNGYSTGPLRGRNTSLAIASVPVSLYLFGLASKDSYSRGSALLAAESIVDSQIVALSLKSVTGRRFPSDIPPHGDFTHTWFKYQGTMSNPGSFPSGHATMAFAAASVFARRYREHHACPGLRTAQPPSSPSRGSQTGRTSPRTFSSVQLSATSWAISSSCPIADSRIQGTTRER
jgi:membrane-associated phospholipid phosphatase